MTCNHYRWEEKWVINDDPDDERDWWQKGRWEKNQISTCVDLDLHRWKCTQCGHIGYYSGRARDHFEGKTNDSFIAETNRDYMNRQGK